MKGLKVKYILLDKVCPVHGENAFSLDVSAFDIPFLFCSLILDTSNLLTVCHPAFLKKQLLVHYQQGPSKTPGPALSRWQRIFTFVIITFYNGYVRGSPNGKICKSTNGTVGTIFTNGNQKTLNVFLLPMVPLVPMVPMVPMVPLVDHMVEFLSY